MSPPPFFLILGGKSAEAIPLEMKTVILLQQPESWAIRHGNDFKI